MKKAALACLMVLAFAASAGAAYRIYLKSGSVIEGVSSYQRSGGEIRFRLPGGSIGVPEGDVLKIEEYSPSAREKMKEEPPLPPPVPPEAGPPPEKKDSPARVAALKNRLVGVSKDIADIEEKEGELKKLKDELRTVELRIEVLFKTGRENALKAGKSPVEAQKEYIQFLTPEQRQFVQLNFLKKRELEGLIKKMEEEEMEPLLAEKEKLLEEREKIESELKGLQSEKAF
jgi:hypothetical protein